MSTMPCNVYMKVIELTHVFGCLRYVWGMFQVICWKNQMVHDGAVFFAHYERRRDFARKYCVVLTEPFRQRNKRQDLRCYFEVEY